MIYCKISCSSQEHQGTYADYIDCGFCQSHTVVRVDFVIFLIMHHSYSPPPPRPCVPRLWEIEEFAAAFCGESDMSSD